MSNENREPLSAAAAAVRVAARHRRRPRLHEGDDPGYHCENCGSEEFIVEEVVTDVVVVDLSWPCEHDHGSAAIRRIAEFTTLRRSASLDEDHRCEPNDDDDEMIDYEEEERLFDVACSSCLEIADADDVERGEVERDTVERETWVCCAECGHEIEFGWSHPDGGRIWPCEAADFNPWKSWPEARYVEAWAERGWLRPLS